MPADAVILPIVIKAPDGWRVAVPHAQVREANGPWIWEYSFLAGRACKTEEAAVLAATRVATEATRG